MAKAFLIFCFPLFLWSSPLQQINFMLHHGDIENALDTYNDWYVESGHHDYDTLQKIGIQLLEKGWRSSKPEEQLVTLFGARIADHDDVIPLLKRALSSREPLLQHTALNILARKDCDAADDAIKKGFLNAHPLIRLEACLYLAQKKDPQAVRLTENLMEKFPSEVRFFFPQIFAAVHSKEATNKLRKLLNDPSLQVRLEAIKAVSIYHYEELIEKVRLLSKGQHHAIQEVSILTLSEFHDTSSQQLFHNLLSSPSTSVQLAAASALHNIGQKEHANLIEELAKKENPFAITTLSEIADSEPLLIELQQHSSVSTRVNATLTLLQKKHPAALRGLPEILILDARDIAISPISSQGGALSAWKVISSAHNKLDESGIELSQSIRENILTQAIEIPSDEVLSLIEVLFLSRQNALIPTAVNLLENMQTEKSIALLEKYSSSVGMPLARHYCSLALYRMYQDLDLDPELFEWIDYQTRHAKIQLRPVLPLKERIRPTPYNLNADESTRLFISALETIISRDEERGKSLVLTAIRHGVPENRYALAGLLIKISQ